MRTHLNGRQYVKQVQARSGDEMDVDAFTDGSKGASEGSGKKQDSEVVFLYFVNKGHRASDCRKQRDNSGKSEGSKKGESKGKSNMGKVHIRSWRRVGRDRMHRNGKRVFERIGDWSSAVAVKESQNSHWNRFVCFSNCVHQECCGRLSDAPHARESEELQTSVRLGARQVQVKFRDGVFQIHEPQSCGHAQSVDDGVRDERHETRCLLPKERQRHQGVRVPREQWHETGVRESE